MAAAAPISSNCRRDSVMRRITALLPCRLVERSISTRRSGAQPYRSLRSADGYVSMAQTAGGEPRSDNKGNKMKRFLLAALMGCAALTAAKAQDTIRVGWTIPAEEAKYWMMRRPDKFPNLGKGYKIEWSQFQGT